MTDQASTDLREEVRARYAEAARAVMAPKPASSASCGSGAGACCGTGSAALAELADRVRRLAPRLAAAS